MIPVKFTYFVDEKGNMSDLRYKTVHHDLGLGMCELDYYMKDYKINPDKKGFNFKMEIPEWFSYGKNA